MNDRLDFSIDGVKRSIEEMRESNSLNEKNKEALLDYVRTKLAPEWNTVQGKEAVAELENFANTKFQEYIDYLNGKINDLDNVVVPALERINNA